MTTTKPILFAQLQKLVSELDPRSVTGARKAVLQPLIDYIKAKVAHDQEIRINFICTHNSRRSHLSQVWAQTMAYCYNIENVCCYSGGTEATALFPMVAKTLQDSGFRINAIAKGDNPVYSIKYADNRHPIIGFSKRFDDGFNPGSGFAAVMTCHSANEACPFVPGAEKRVPITFEDPKIFDNSPQQAEKYLERSMQIATEMKYVFSHIEH